MTRLPVVEGKFTQVGDVWHVQGNANALAAAVDIGAAIIVKSNGKRTMRTVTDITSNGVVVGPKVWDIGKVHVNAMPADELNVYVTAGVTFEDVSTPTRASKAPGKAAGKAPGKAAGKASTQAPANDIVAQVTAAVLAALQLSGAPVSTQAVAAAVVSTQTPARKPASPAQLAARQRFGDAARARSASKSLHIIPPTNTVTPDLGRKLRAPLTQVITVPELPTQTSADKCVCGDGHATHVHHGASKIADHTVRTCKQCAKNLDGKSVIEWLAAQVK